MLGMSPAGTAVVCVVAIVAVTLLVASVIQAVKDTRIAGIDADARIAIDKNRAQVLGEDSAIMDSLIGSGESP